MLDNVDASPLWRNSRAGCIFDEVVDAVGARQRRPAVEKSRSFPRQETSSDMAEEPETKAVAIRRGLAVVIGLERGPLVPSRAPSETRFEDSPFPQRCYVVLRIHSLGACGDNSQDAPGSAQAVSTNL